MGRFLPPDTQNQVFEEDTSGDAECVGSEADCENSEYRSPWDVMNRLEIMMTQMAPEWCCSGVEFFCLRLVLYFRGSARNRAISIFLSISCGPPVVLIVFPLPHCKSTHY